MHIIYQDNQIMKVGILKIVLLVSFSFLSSCISFSADVYGGAYTIEKVTLTDVWNDDFSTGAPRDTFDGNERIIAVVETSGYEGIITMRWFQEDQLIYETSNKTQNNYFSTHIGPENDFYWIPPGDYRVEVGIGSTAKFTEYFTVREDDFERFEVESPIIPPAGHIKQEGSDLIEFPFAFDEIWTIDGDEWSLNEAKIVFLRTANDPVISFVFTQPDLVEEFSNQQEGKERTLPVAKYAKDKGYISEAEKISIGGQTFTFKNIFITFIRTDESKKGYRVPFDIAELE